MITWSAHPQAMVRASKRSRIDRRVNIILDAELVWLRLLGASNLKPTQRCEPSMECCGVIPNHTWLNSELFLLG